MLKAHTVLIVFYSFMIYYFLSSTILMICFFTSVRAHKPGKERKRLSAIYVLYWIVSVVFALLPIIILDDNNTSRSYFSIYFTVFFLLLLIFSIVILKIVKGTDKSKKVIFSVVILNLVASLIYWGIGISSSRYRFLHCDSDHLFIRMTDLLQPDSETSDSETSDSGLKILPGWFRHKYNRDENHNNFVRNCVFNLNIPKKDPDEKKAKTDLAEYAKKQIQKITWPKIPSENLQSESSETEYETTKSGKIMSESEKRAIDGFNSVMDRTGGVTKDQFEKNVCEAFYAFMSSRKDADNENGPGVYTYSL